MVEAESRALALADQETDSVAKIVFDVVMVRLLEATCEIDSVCEADAVCEGEAEARTLAVADLATDGVGKKESAEEGV